MAASHNSLGLDYLHKDEYHLARYHLRRAFDIETTLHGKDGHTNISKRLGHIALAHQLRGNTELALKNFEHALSIEQRLLPSQHIYIGLRYENIGLCHELLVNYSLALKYYQIALFIVERTLPIYHKRHRKILKGILDTSYKLDAYRQAIEFAISILDNDQTGYKGWTMVRLSELYLKIDDSSKAYQYFQNELTFSAQNQSSNSIIISTFKEELKQFVQSFSLITGNKRNF